MCFDQYNQAHVPQGLVLLSNCQKYVKISNSWKEYQPQHTKHIGLMSGALQNNLQQSAAVKLAAVLTVYRTV